MYSALEIFSALAISSLATLSPDPASSQSGLIPVQLTSEPSAKHLPRARKLAQRGDAQAQFLVFELYNVLNRRDSPPWESSETLVSRAEAEAALRAAAAQGHMEAQRELEFRLFHGIGMARDRADLIGLLESRLDGPDDQKGRLSGWMAEALASQIDPSESDLARALSLAGTALARGYQPAIRTRAGALAATDPAAARAELENAYRANPYAALPLARMLIDGIGGPADLDRARGLLQSSQDIATMAELGRQHLPGGIMPRDPRKAIALMARQALFDPDTRQELARWLKTYRVKLDNDDQLHRLMLEDADLGLPDAALNVVNLHKVHREGFRSMRAWFDLLPRFARDVPQIAVYDVDKIAGFARASSGVNRERFEKQVRDKLAALEARNVAAAFTLHGLYLQKGVIYPQDSVAAVRHFARAAELGDVEGMVELADALDSGDGVARDRAAAIAWLRYAAYHGSFEARGEMVRRFSLLSRDNGISLGEGITFKIAMYGDGIGSLGALGMSGFLVGAEMSGLQAGEILAPFYDGFRISPAAAEDRLLVPLIKNTPDWIWQATETILKHQNFWNGDPQGHMGPDAREAFRAFIAAAGPMSYEAVSAAAQ